MEVRSYSVYEVDVSQYERLDRYELLQLLADVIKALSTHTYVRIRACNHRNVNDVAYVVALAMDVLKDVQVSARIGSANYVNFDGLVFRVPCLEIELRNRLRKQA